MHMASALDCRTSIARTLADGTGADFSDILVLKQEIYSIGFGFRCLNVTVRVLGPTRKYKVNTLYKHMCTSTCMCQCELRAAHMLLIRA